MVSGRELPRRVVLASALSGASALVLGGGRAWGTTGATATTALGVARRAEDLTRSVGVCAHWGYTDTPYSSRYAAVRDLLVGSGVRRVRGDVFRAADLWRSGIRTTAVLEPLGGARSPEGVLEGLRGLVRSGAVDTVEGANEPDLFWVRAGRSYRGHGFPEGPRLWQQDVHSAVRSDPVLRGLTVVGPSLGRTYWSSGTPYADGSLAAAVDWGNFHPYPTGNSFCQPQRYAGIDRYYWNADFPSATLDRHPINLETYRPPFGSKPMAATETGYSTWRLGQSERVQGIYLPRLFLENLRLGIRRTYAYELVDEFADAQGTDRGAHFGLVRHDLTPKPAYHAVQALLSTAGEVPGRRFTPDRLDADLVVTAPAGYDPGYLHHLLLQRRDRSFVLALWHEVSSDDLSPLASGRPPREVAQPSMAVRISFGARVAEVRVRRIAPSGALAQVDRRTAAQTVSLDVGPAVTFVEVSRSSPLRSTG